jgi:hypothetical protein
MTGRARTRARGPKALVRLAEGDWPSPSVVTDIFGGWPAAREAAANEHSAVVPDRCRGLVLG